MKSTLYKAPALKGKPRKKEELHPADEMNGTLYQAFAFMGLLVLFIWGATQWRESTLEWKRYQKAYSRLLSEKAKDPAEKKRIVSLPLEVKQVVVPELGKVDRCMTCHLGLEEPEMKDAPQPFRSHPNPFQHPFDRFGCTVCHSGQGRATTSKAAHGRVEHWEAPMLPMEYIQSSCGKCHLPSDIPHAPILAKGKRLFEIKACRGCHKLHGEGGSIGGDLTHVGRPGHRNPQWLFAHFKNPKSVSPGTVMPNYGFSNEEARALTMFMLSLTDERVVDYFIGKKVIPSIDVGERLSREMGCIGCHSINGQGGQVGPDLSQAGMRHDANWIFQHFLDPRKVSPGTVMPKFGFTEDEARALTMYVLRLSLSPQRPGESAPPTKAVAVQASPGEQAFAASGCLGCHKVKGLGGEMGGDLTHIGSRRDEEWLFHWIKNPQLIKPDAIMPNLGVSDKDARILADYLTSLR